MAAHHHPADALQDALDGRLDADRWTALDQHLATCDLCRRELEALRWTKRQIAGAGRTNDVPADLEARLRVALDEEDRRRAAGYHLAAAPSAAPIGTRSRTWVAWVAAAAAMVAVVWLGTRPRGPSVPAQAAADFRAVVSGALRLDVETTEPSALEARFRQEGLSFSARVFDFGMMEYRLAGGRMHRVAGKTSALFAYRGPEDRALVCQMGIRADGMLNSSDLRG